MKNDQEHIFLTFLLETSFFLYFLHEIELEVERKFEVLQQFCANTYEEF